jgi:tetratricopeptide (TPR) repeat protein
MSSSVPSAPRRRVLAAIALTAGLVAAFPMGRAAGAGKGPRSRVVFVAWDGADWSLLDPMMKTGRLPHLSALVAKGRTWNLASIEPMMSPIIWTTVATGRTPVDHGVADFQEIDPSTKTRLPISGRSRKVPAIWNLASAKGVSVGIVGWWATWPAEKVNGFFVSDRTSPVLFDPNVLSRSPALTWPDGLADGVRIVVKREGSPPFEDVAKALRISRAEFDDAVAAGKDLMHPVTAYRKILGSTRVHARIALDLYDRERPELLMVYFQGTDEIGHVFGRFHPPKLATVSEPEFAKFSDGAAALYVEADRILGKFAARAEKDGATLLLASDHGFKWGPDRPAYYSGVQFDTAFLWHHSPGVLVAAGPAVTRSTERGTANVFDLTPTLCALLGLPADPAFEGRPIPGLSGKKAPAPVPPEAWEKVAKVERLAAAGLGSEEKKAADEFTKKLISLGYLTGAEAAAVDARPAERAGAETAGHFQNIGTFLRERGKVQESLSWYRKALEVNPAAPIVSYNLSGALFKLERWDEADDALLTAMRNGYNDPEATAYRRVAAYMRLSAKKPEERRHLVSFLKKLVEAYPKNDRYRASLGKIHFEDRACAESERIFRDIVARHPDDTEALNVLALSCWCEGKRAEAVGFFQRSLSLAPDQPVVREGLSELQRGGEFAR